jgi:hypothetical protein
LADSTLPEMGTVRAYVGRTTVCVRTTRPVKALHGHVAVRFQTAWLPAFGGSSPGPSYFLVAYNSPQEVFMPAPISRAGVVTDRSPWLRLIRFIVGSGARTSLEFQGNRSNLIPHCVPSHAEPLSILPRVCIPFVPLDTAWLAAWMVFRQSPLTISQQVAPRLMRVRHQTFLTLARESTTRGDDIGRHPYRPSRAKGRRGAETVVSTLLLEVRAGRCVLPAPRTGILHGVVPNRSVASVLSL